MTKTYLLVRRLDWHNGSTSIVPVKAFSTEAGAVEAGRRRDAELGGLLEATLTLPNGTPTTRKLMNVLGSLGLAGVAYSVECHETHDADLTAPPMPKILLT